jgi:hypothetical protein
MRIQIVVDDAYKGMLEDLKRVTGLQQWQDLFSDAITMYNWAVKQRMEGRIITSMNEQEENYRELQMPSLERAAEYAKRGLSVAALAATSSKASAS